MNAVGTRYAPNEMHTSLWEIGINPLLRTMQCISTPFDVVLFDCVPFFFLPFFLLPITSLLIVRTEAYCLCRQFRFFRSVTHTVTLDEFIFLPIHAQFHTFHDCCRCRCLLVVVVKQVLSLLQTF